MSTKTVTRCSTCTQTIETCPIEERKIVVTACFHIYCLQCLKDWVKQLEKPCPLCRQNIYQKQSSKDFHVMWKIFMKILQLNPEFVYGSLKENIGQQESCSACLEEFPSIPIQFDRTENKFHHLECINSVQSLKNITVKDIIGIIQAYKETDQKLKEKLTPTGPTIYDRVKTYLFG